MNQIGQFVVVTCFQHHWVPQLQGGLLEGFTVAELNTDNQYLVGYDDFYMCTCVSVQYGEILCPK